MAEGGLSRGGIFNFLLASDMAASQAKTNRALYKKRYAENVSSAKQANLARWSQSLQNSKIMERAGENFNVISENLTRAADTHAMGGVQASLALSEEIGAATAAASAAGLGGSSVEAYNNTVRAQHAMQKELSDRSYNSQSYLMGKQRSSQISDGVDGMSRDVIMANFDFTNYGPAKGPSFLGNLATLAVAVGASAAGAPDIGNAILSARTSGMQASYGDGAGAQKSFGKAVEQFGQGVGQVQDKFRFSSGPAKAQSLGIQDNGGNLVTTRFDAGFSSFNMR